MQVRRAGGGQRGCAGRHQGSAPSQPGRQAGGPPPAAPALPQMVMARPEQAIAVVSHSGFLHQMLANFGRDLAPAVRGEMHLWCARGCGAQRAALAPAPRARARAAAAPPACLALSPCPAAGMKTARCAPWCSATRAAASSTQTPCTFAAGTAWRRPDWLAAHTRQAAAVCAQQVGRPAGSGRRHPCGAARALSAAHAGCALRWVVCWSPRCVNVDAAGVAGLRPGQMASQMRRTLAHVLSATLGTLGCTWWNQPRSHLTCPVFAGSLVPTCSQVGVSCQGARSLWLRPPLPQAPHCARAAAPWCASTWPSPPLPGQLRPPRPPQAAGRP